MHNFKTRRSFWSEQSHRVLAHHHSSPCTLSKPN
ncbi:hypothetical protein RSAG8_02289, partial [Rhizoctonia solani AG-8 WAC10335]